MHKVVAGVMLKCDLSSKTRFYSALFYKSPCFSLPYLAILVIMVGSSGIHPTSKDTADSIIVEYCMEVFMKYVFIHHIDPSQGSSIVNCYQNLLYTLNTNQN